MCSFRLQLLFARDKDTSVGKLPVIELFLLSLCLLISVSVGSSDGHLVTCLASDREALLDFKTGLHDPNNVLSSWRGSSNCCEWHGIECDNTTKAVVAVDLHNPSVDSSFESSSYGRYVSWNLSGEISPSLMKLKSLRLLDLSFNTFNGVPIPEFFGSLEHLQHLNLSQAGFRGLIPPNLGNLSHLKVLDLDGASENELYADSFQWITGLISLEHLVMNWVDLSLVKDWVGAVNQAPSIVELHLSGCQLSGYIPSMASLNFSSLAVMDLSWNRFHSKMPGWLVNISSLQHIDMSYSDLYGRIPLGLGDMPKLLSLLLEGNLNLTARCSQLFRKGWEKIQVLDLSFNIIQGKLPSTLGNMTSLTRLYLNYNTIKGGIPNSIGKLCNLNDFSLLSNNIMMGNLPKILEGTQTCPFKKPLHNLQYLILSNNQLGSKIPYWLSQLENIVELDLSNNSLEGPIPNSLGSLQHLGTLQLQKNKLNGTLPESLGQLFALSKLDVSSNQLAGIISEIHFPKLKNLKFIDLSSNLFIVNISSKWMPPFQVTVLRMSSCILGPSFPSWIESQKEMEFLELSKANISDSIPDWFWMGTTNLSFLSLSQNQISGQIPESIGETCNSLWTIDFSSNNFTGRIPSSLANCSNLQILDLSDNNLFGAIPNSLGQLRFLKLLYLSNNQLSGKLPSSFMNLSYLQILDLGNNELSGGIPSWIGDGFSNLTILKLRSNAFFGQIPHELSNLSSLQVLDLGENDLSGSIPTSFGDFKAITQEKRDQHFDFNVYQGVINGKDSFDIQAFQDRLVVNAKGQSLVYTKTLSLVTSIDLSGNNLFGRFPRELTKLHGLTYLNLSRNYIAGSIPDSISNMHQLSSLDLSSNQLTGSITQNLSSLSFLGYLNLSYNNLSGAIPYIGHTTTFEASSFVGNPDLYGCPLPVRCLHNGDGHFSVSNGEAGNGKTDDSDGLIDKWFYLSLGLGFAAGLLVPFLILAMKRSWSDAYFDFVEVVIVKFLVLMRRTRINHGYKIKPRRHRL